MAWVALDEPEKVARKKIEITRLAISKLTVCDLVKLSERVVGGFLTAVAMGEVVGAVDPTFCRPKDPTFWHTRAQAFSGRLKDLIRRGRKSDADALGGSSPSVSLGSGPWAKAKRKKKTGKKSSNSRERKQATDSPPRSPFKQPPRSTPPKKQKQSNTPTKQPAPLTQQAASWHRVQMQDLRSQLKSQEGRHGKQQQASDQRVEGLVTEMDVLRQEARTARHEIEKVTVNTPTRLERSHSSLQEEQKQDKVSHQHSSEIQQTVQKLAAEAAAAAKSEKALQRVNVKQIQQIQQIQQHASQLHVKNNELGAQLVEAKSTATKNWRLLQQKISSLGLLQKREKLREQQVVQAVFRFVFLCISLNKKPKQL